MRYQAPYLYYYHNTRLLRSVLNTHLAESSLKPSPRFEVAAIPRGTLKSPANSCSFSSRQHMDDLAGEKISHRLLPKLVETLPGYTFQRLFADVVAGITVGLVALPLAMAFAISSGVTPEAGIYTAIVAGFVVSAFGGSR